jgi:hypothetical protein
MIILIILGSILGYILMGMATIRTVNGIDREVLRSPYNDDLSIIAATITFLFWPVTFAILTIIAFGLLFLRGPWKAWGHLIRKIVGE